MTEQQLRDLKRRDPLAYQAVMMATMGGLIGMGTLLTLLVVAAFFLP